MSDSQQPVSSSPFIRQWEDTRSDVLNAVAAVGESGWYILGERVRRFEEKIAAYCGRTHGVGCASGLDAIELALRVLGLRPGDKVLTTPLSAFATTLAIVRAGGRPVFVDTDEFGLLDLDLADQALEHDSEIRFLVPVHLYGRCLDIGRLTDIQSRHGIPVIEDCAQALGAAHDGRPAGSVGLVARRSFYPTKSLGALGDGGALVTDDPEVAELAGRLRDYGQGAKFEHLHIGMNSRLDELHAAVLEDVFLPRLEEWNTRRAEVAGRYLEGISNPDVRPVPTSRGFQSSWHLFPVRVPEDGRAAFRAHLEAGGVPTAVHYPTLIPSQPALSSVPHEVIGTVERARALTEEEVSLPIHAYLLDWEVERVVQLVNEWRAERGNGDSAGVNAARGDAARGDDAEGDDPEGDDPGGADE
jgi:dTDP-3-amino-3,4,6-trideoxy-alpha-D-glucose transaminase